MASERLIGPAATRPAWSSTRGRRLLALAELAETVEDEWQYVTDLVDAYLPEHRGPGRRRTRAALDGRRRVAAVDEAIAEIGLITDPHKAIDWLSTFPHVVAWRSAAMSTGRPERLRPAAPTAATEPDDDSPFRALLRRRPMRFQDAAKDARAVVYAGIQADPLVARAATLLAEATTAERLLARAAMNGERTDAGDLAADVPDALWRGRRTRRCARHAELVLAASLEVANRGEAARSSATAARSSRS